MGMGIEPEVKRSHRNNISYMVIHRKPIKYHLFSDKNNTIEIDHKGIKNLCIKNNIEFKNQTFPSLIRSLKDQFFNL